MAQSFTISKNTSFAISGVNVASGQPSPDALSAVSASSGDVTIYTVEMDATVPNQVNVTMVKNGNADLSFIATATHADGTTTNLTGIATIVVVGVVQANPATGLVLTPV